jgi:hypothetical protein
MINRHIKFFIYIVYITMMPLSLELSILIGLFVITVLYVVCQQKADIYEIILITLAVLIILMLTYKTYENFSSNASANVSAGGCTAGERGLVYGAIITKDGDPTEKRKQQIIYAGDIINFYVPKTNRRLALSGRPSQLMVTDSIQNDLQKLRIVLNDPNNKLPADRLYPVRYGDVVRLVFTLGRRKTMFLGSDGKTLDIIEPNTKGINDLFQLVNPNSPQSKEVIKTESDVAIRVYNEGSVGGSTYVTETRLGQLTTANPPKSATVFQIVPGKECSPNWMFNYGDPKEYLLNKSDASDFMTNINQGLNQQINDFKSRQTRQRNFMEDNCAKQLQEIMKERAELQTKINLLKNK